MHILALDVGTTSMRGILFDGSGRILDSVSVQTPLLLSDTCVEQLPSRLLDALITICRSISQSRSIDLISITAFRSAVCLLDAAGEPLTRFIMWQDTRNKDICARYEPERREIQQRSGADLNTVFTATRICWFREHEPELYRRAAHVITVPDYLIYQMSGNFVTDHTYGSRTHLMNIASRQWDEELCTLFGIDKDLLCPLVPCGSVVGTVTAGFSRHTGIAAGTPIVTAGGDQQCSALGLGILDASSVEINSGTGSFLLTTVDHPYLENPSVICNAASIPGKYIVESNVITTGSAINWMAENFFPDCASRSEAISEMNRLASQVPPGSGGVRCLPHFQGCGARDWNPNSTAFFSGITLGTTRADCVRALFEGIAAEIAKSLSALPVACLSGIWVSGGLSNSPQFNQILADMINTPIRQYSTTQEATAAGAFIVAAVSAGLFASYEAAIEAVHAADLCACCMPQEDVVPVYQRCQRATERLYQALKETEVMV